SGGGHGSRHRSPRCVLDRVETASYARARARRGLYRPGRGRSILTPPGASAILPVVIHRARGTAPMTLLRTLAVVAVAAWLGIMAFFSFEVAPVVFRTIDRAIAGQAVTAVLPRYYRWGLALSGVALVASALQAISGK